ncbi:sugar ABC transporter ATP-binding protein [Nakamurella deserti]|uniref:sugar ABC transporter ATP-binding protein n=1 Tax=Nakamurella deserti TaxID=2164074 RepID=UPI000DBE60F8|nr:sugar ABC transporter ATP-binding protein [Nakamurella deserti]
MSDAAPATTRTDPAARPDAIHTAPGRALSGSGLRKSYAGVEVVKGVDFTVPAGAVVGLIGENGAGKSTLSSMIAGIVPPTAGSMTLDGESYAPTSPSEALDRGVALIHQEIRMVPSLSVAENIFLGRLPLRGGRVDTAAMVRRSREVLDVLGIDLDPRRPVTGLSMAAQQSIEIAKAISRKPRYVIFDEPSASLTGHETDLVLDQIRRMAATGVGVVYISHRLEEVRDVCSQIICLRDGALVRHWETGDVPAPEMVSAMVGRDFAFEHHAPEPHREDVVLEVRGLGRRGAFSGVDFTVSRGEILGVAGLVGAGRTEMVRTIAGADRFDEGEVRLEGRPLALHSPSAAIAEGIVMVPEDRKGQGLNLGLSSAANILQPWEREMGRGRAITQRLLNRAAAKSREDFDIRGSMDLPVVRLSGGNQQKVLLAKWLVHEPKVLILDEPTRGVDVGAKMAIYRIVRDCAARGVAVVVVSSELEEVLGLSHRVLVMSGGRQRGILTREQATAEAVMQLAVPMGQQ